MSIFPKRVTKGENVIVHFKIKNNQKVKFISYEITFYDPIGNVVEVIKDTLLSCEEREVYFCHKVREDELPGKYYLKTKMYINGRVIGSFSSVADFYYVDELQVINTRDVNESESFIIKNIGMDMTPFQLINKEGIVLVEENFEPNEEKNTIIHSPFF